MIHDLDETLRTFVRRYALPDNGVEVVFDAPTKEWAGRRNAPTVDLYLYDIREDPARRHAGQVVRRDDQGVPVQREQPPRWFKLSYLVTAWTQRPEDEHRLLSVLLQCFLTRDSLPAEVLAGSLDGSGARIGYTCALPPPQDRALSDVWSALGGELKPSLDLVLTAPFDLAVQIDVGPPVAVPLGVGITDISGGARQPPLLRTAVNANGTPADGDTDSRRTNASPERTSDRAADVPKRSTAARKDRSAGPGPEPSSRRKPTGQPKKRS
jgi:hypothetical protein